VSACGIGGISTPGGRVIPGGSVPVGGTVTPGGSVPAGGTVTPGGSVPVGGTVTPGGSVPAGGTVTPGGSVPEGGGGGVYVGGIGGGSDPLAGAKLTASEAMRVVAVVSATRAVRCMATPKSSNRMKGGRFKAKPLDATDQSV